MTLKFRLFKHDKAADGSDQIHVRTVLSVPEFEELSKLLGFDEGGGLATAGNVTRGGIEDIGTAPWFGCKITPDGPEPQLGASLPPAVIEMTTTTPRGEVVADETD